MHADAHLRNFGDDRFDRLLNAALEFHRVRPGGDVLQPFAIDRLGQNGRGGRAVAGVVVGLRRHLAHHLRTHVGDRILQLDLLGDGHAVLGDLRSAELLVDDDVATFGAERDLHGVRQRVDTLFEHLARLYVIFDLFCHSFYGI